MSRMTLVGLITNEDIRCPALRTSEGQLYTLAYAGEPEIQVGDLVRVSGVPAQLSICMHGVTIQVESLQILYRSGGATLTSLGKTGIFPIPGLPAPSRAVLVSKVSDVKLYILKCHPPKLSISVQGFYSSTGWSCPHLDKRAYIVEPADGIYDFLCLALPPSGEADWTRTPFSFTQTENLPMSLKGVRIYSQTKTPFVKMLDDSKAAIAEPDSCAHPDFKDWQGKRFIRSGQANPGGDVVLEDTLINQGIRYRVLGPNDVGDMMFDPGRVTIHLDEKDIVIAVSWG